MDINLRTLKMPAGFKIYGENNYDSSGYSVSSVGDVNGDKLDDFIIGSSVGSSNPGKSYVILGKASGFYDISLSTLSMPVGFRIIGENINDRSGFSVKGAGDFNGDGYSDIIVGALYGSSLSGKSYIIFGKESGFSDINLQTLSMPIGFKILGENSGDWSGYSVSSAGNINGDEFDDIIIGAPQSSPSVGTGKSYVIFGKASGFKDINLSTLKMPAGFKIFGENSGDWSGFSVSSAGDVNGDEFDDMLIGAPHPYDEPGKSYVIFGKASGFEDINLSTLNSTIGFRILGESIGDEVGISVSSARDMNGDMFADMLIGGTGATGSGIGAGYVIFGKANFSDIYLGNLSMPLGFKILGISGEECGRSISSAGDINGDKLDDVLIGAPAGSSGAGKSYIILSQASGYSEIHLSNLIMPLGFRVLGENSGDRSGYSVSSAGDLDKDGHADMLIGAPAGSSDTGKSYVLFGKSIFPEAYSSSTGTFNLPDSETSVWDNFKNIGIPILGAVSSIAGIMGGFYTLSKCRTDQTWCWAPEGCMAYASNLFRELCCNEYRAPADAAEAAQHGALVAPQPLDLG